jgi:hypothetical protein
MSAVAGQWSASSLRDIIPRNIRKSMYASNLKIGELIGFIHALHSSQSLDVEGPGSDQNRCPYKSK